MKKKLLALAFVTMVSFAGVKAEESNKGIAAFIQSEVKKELEKEQKKVQKQLLDKVVNFLKKELPGMVKDIVTGGFSRASSSLGSWFWGKKEKKEFHKDVEEDKQDFLDDLDDDPFGMD